MYQFMSSQKGFSLIEALIALVVLSIGLMGVAAMQLKALQSATAGYQRSVATLAAVDAQERLWAELAELAEGESCQDISESALTAVREEWETWWRDDDASWRDDSDSNPLRNVDWGGSGIDRPPDSCEFTITIDLGDGPGDIDGDAFTYTFRLPEKP